MGRASRDGYTVAIVGLAAALVFVAGQCRPAFAGPDGGESVSLWGYSGLISMPNAYAKGLRELSIGGQMLSFNGRYTPVVYGAAGVFDRLEAALVYGVPGKDGTGLSGHIKYQLFQPTRERPTAVAIGWNLLGVSNMDRYVDANNLYLVVSQELSLPWFGKRVSLATGHFGFTGNPMQGTSRMMGGLTVPVGSDATVSGEYLGVGATGAVFNLGVLYRLFDDYRLRVFTMGVPDRPWTEREWGLGVGYAGSFWEERSKERESHVAPLRPQASVAPLPTRVLPVPAPPDVPQPPRIPEPVDMVQETVSPLIVHQPVALPSASPLPLPTVSVTPVSVTSPPPVPAVTPLPVPSARPSVAPREVVLASPSPVPVTPHPAVTPGDAVSISPSPGQGESPDALVGAVAGTLVDDQGKALAGWVLRVKEGPWSVVTGNGGNFRLNLPLGPHDILVQDRAGVVCLRKPVRLISPRGLTLALTVSLARGSVKGVVRDRKTHEGVSDAQVSLVRDGETRHFKAQKTGEFVLADLPVGQYRLQVNGARYDSQSVTIQVQDKRVLPLTVDLSARPGQLSGRVVSAKGLPAAQVEVVLDGAKAATTDKHGEFRCAGLPPGEHELVLMLGGQRVGGKAVRIKSEESVIENFSLVETDTGPQKAGVIAGTVTDAVSGQPLSGVKLVVEGRDLTVLTLSGPTGRYSVTDLPPGRYQVTASRARYQKKLAAASVTPRAGAWVNLTMQPQLGKLP